MREPARVQSEHGVELHHELDGVDRVHPETGSEEGRVGVDGLGLDPKLHGVAEHAPDTIEDRLLSLRRSRTTQSASVTSVEVRMIATLAVVPLLATRALLALPLRSASRA